MLNLSGHQVLATRETDTPVLTVVVDTEEEFDWDKPFSRDSTSTSSIASQPLAHEQVFDRFGVVPTYVIDWPVATSTAAVQVLGKLMAEGRCEIGTHLHPWVSPPHDEVVNNFNSYAGNLPQELEYKKIELLTNAIQTAFGRRPTVFKAGRYGVGPHTADTLAKLGYLIDASVVPFTQMTADGGPDFSKHGVHPYWFTANNQRLLELPATAGYAGMLHRQGQHLHPKLQSNIGKQLRLPSIASRAGLLERIKLTPEGYTTQELVALTKCLHKQGCRYFGLTYHSPSLAPGNTSYVKSQQELDQFLLTLSEYIDFFLNDFHGKTQSLSGYLNTANSLPT